jgi:hypothetical protein
MLSRGLGEAWWCRPGPHAPAPVVVVGGDNAGEDAGGGTLDEKLGALGWDEEAERVAGNGGAQPGCPYRLAPVVERLCRSEERVGVTTFKGAAPLIDNKTYLDAAAGM